MFITGTLCKNWNRDKHKGGRRVGGEQSRGVHAAWRKG